MMDVTRFIAGKLRLKGNLAVGCICVSFLVMTIAVSVSSGFRDRIREGVGTISGDIQVCPLNNDVLGPDSPISLNQGWLSRVDSLPAVKSITPVVYRAGVVKSDDNIHGILFKGVPVDKSDSSSAMTVEIPRKLSRLVGLDIGDSFLAYFIGERLKVRKFTVKSIYDGILEADDNLVAFVPLDVMQKLNGWDEDRVSAFEIQAYPPYKNDKLLKDLESKIGYMIYEDSGEESHNIRASASVTKYPQLFDWLNLIDFNVGFILLLMTIVAGFNMISGLLIMLFENISTIGLLKSLGMQDRSIAKVFLRCSSTLVLKGMLIGTALAGVFCIVQSETHLLKLDPENYFLSFVPVKFDAGMILFSDIICYLVIMLLLSLPSIFISKVDPADTVRAD